MGRAVHARAQHAWRNSFLKASMVVLLLCTCFFFVFWHSLNGHGAPQVESTSVSAGVAAIAAAAEEFLSAEARAAGVSFGGGARTFADARACQGKHLQHMVGKVPCDDMPRAAGASNGSAKVALLFLVKDAIPTEPIWAAFLAAAAELTLRQAVPATRPAPPDLLPQVPPHADELSAPCWRHGGTDKKMKVMTHSEYLGGPAPRIANSSAWLTQQCTAGLTGAAAYAQQDLFSIYVHQRPGAAPFPVDSVFHGREIEHRVHATFAQPSLVAAHRLLLASALRDERNSMFVLLSESCLPLYHPALFWAQLISESHISRVADTTFIDQRWTPFFETDFFKAGDFKKSSQFSSLTRMHAQVVAFDRHVWSQFEAFCRTQLQCNRGWWSPTLTRICIADEHYVASVLHAYRMKDSYDHVGTMTFTEWRGGWHPRTFYPDDVPTAITTMRTCAFETPAGCEAMPQRALRSAAALFTPRRVCAASGHDAIPLEGPHYDVMHADRTGPLPEPDPPPPKWTWFKCANKLAPPWHGSPKEKRKADRTFSIQRARRDNLAATKWLGRFEPMRVSCPLVARKVAPEAVAAFAAIAWRCDGLGFAWECIEPTGGAGTAAAVQAAAKAVSAQGAATGAGAHAGATGTTARSGATAAAAEQQGDATAAAFEWPWKLPH